MIKMAMACCLKYLQITFSWWIFSLSCIQAAQPLPLSDKTQAEGSEGLSSPLKKYDTYSAKEYFYEVPKAWEVQFHRVVSNLSQLLGGYDIDIVAWPSWREPPVVHGKRLERGQYVSGGHGSGGKRRVMLVLEIVQDELIQEHPHMRSVMAHEYFHVYQRHVNPAIEEAFSVKWLIEGSAAVFESMYLRDFEQVDDYAETAQLRHAVPDDFGARMESYDNGDVNYGTSTAMVLLACREGGFQRMLDFWKRQPNNTNWKQLFEELFHVSVEQFYREGQHVSPETLDLSRMGNLHQMRF